MSKERETIIELILDKIKTHENMVYDYQGQATTLEHIRTLKIQSLGTGKDVFIECEDLLKSAEKYREKAIHWNKVLEWFLKFSSKEGNPTCP